MKKSFIETYFTTQTIVNKALNHFGLRNEKTVKKGQIKLSEFSYSELKEFYNDYTTAKQ